MNYNPCTSVCAIEACPGAVIPERQSVRSILAETRELLFKVDDQTGVLCNAIEPEPQRQPSGMQNSDNSLLHLAEELRAMSTIIKARLDVVIDML